MLTLTEEQNRSKTELTAFVDEPGGGMMVLEGFAGTGKTSLLQELVRDLGKEYRIVLTAPTNKAANVLRDKNRAAGLTTPCTTIHKLLGVKPSSKDERRTLEKVGKDTTGEYDVVVIDECSMVNEELMKMIRSRLGFFHKVIFVGDPMQLPPIGEDLSETFKVPRKTRLSTVMRQRDENPIVALTADLRSQIDARRPDFGVFKEAIGSDGAGIYQANGDLKTWLLEAFLSPEFEENNDKFRYLAWTNATVDSINRMVRVKKYGVDAADYIEGERLLFKRPAIKWVRYSDDGRINSPWIIYDLKNTDPRQLSLFNTDEEAVVVSAMESMFDPAQMFADVFRMTKSFTNWMPKVPCWKLLMRGEDGIENEVIVVSKKGLREHQFIESELKARARADRKLWGEYYAYIENFSETQPVYALTIHRSQGSTFETVFVDLLDVRKNKTEVDMLKLLYVASSRPSKFLVV